MNDFSIRWRRESPWWSPRERYRAIARWGAFELQLLAYRTTGVHGQRCVAEVYDAEIDRVLWSQRSIWMDMARREAERAAVMLLPEEAGVALEQFIAKRDERPREVAERNRIARWRRETRPWKERRPT